MVSYTVFHPMTSMTKPLHHTGHLQTIQESQDANNSFRPAVMHRGHPLRPGGLHWRHTHTWITRHAPNTENVLQKRHHAESLSIDNSLRKFEATHSHLTNSKGQRRWNSREKRGLCSFLGHRTDSFPVKRFLVIQCLAEILKKTNKSYIKLYERYFYLQWLGKLIPVTAWKSSFIGSADL